MHRRTLSTVAVLGLDIGGANIKAAFAKTQKGEVAEFFTALEYFPFWKRNPAVLRETLLALGRRVGGSEALDCVAVTMTAELSDVYRTKREGVNCILDSVCKVFAETHVFVLDVCAELRSVDSARQEPLAVASANWAATGWLAAQRLAECVVVDVGSTTTSIIPVRAGKIAAKGKNDLEKLINGELVYTGSLRTNIAAIVSSVPVRGSMARVSSELFAQSGDVHLLLGNITTEEYTTDTADGKGKTRGDALVRMAHLVCADVEMLSEKEILEIAAYIYEKQVAQIAEGLSQVYERLGSGVRKKVPMVLTGLGRHFLARKAAEKAGIAEILDFDEIFPSKAALASPAAGVALMAATKLEGRRLSWKP